MTKLLVLFVLAALTLFTTVVVAQDTNAPPVVKATGGFPITLDGTVTHDNPGSLSILWTLVSGPGQAFFEDASQPQTTVFVTSTGAYTFRLTASDGEFTVSDDVVTTLVFAPNALP